MENDKPIRVRVSLLKVCSQSNRRGTCVLVVLTNLLRTSEYIQQIAIVFHSASGGPSDYSCPKGQNFWSSWWSPFPDDQYQPKLTLRDKHFESVLLLKSSTTIWGLLRVVAYRDFIKVSHKDRSLLTGLAIIFGCIGQLVRSQFCRQNLLVTKWIKNGSCNSDIIRLPKRFSLSQRFDVLLEKPGQ